MMLPVLLGVSIFAVLDVVVETLFLLPDVSLVVRFGASAKKDKCGDKNSNDLFHIV